MFRKNSLLNQLLFAALVFGALHYFLKVSNLEGLSNKDTLRYFSMTGCPHCEKFNDEWNKFTNEKVVKDPVNSNDAVFEKYKQHVQGFPTVILFDSSDNLKKVYEGERTAAGLTAFVEKHAS